MSSAGISFGGLASGLDTKAIITALVAVEQRPIIALEDKKTLLGKQKSLFGDLRGLLEKLQTKAKALNTTSNFLQKKVASDNEDILTASVSGSPTPGSYTIEVLDLAKAQINTVSAASATAQLGTGTSSSILLEIDNQVLPIGIADTSLQGIADAINEQGTGVHADVIDTGNTTNGGADRYQLVVRATEAGTEHDFTISFDDGDAGFQQVITNLASNQRDATDAHIRLNDSADITRSSNSLSDVIPGITIDLKAKQVGTLVNVTVTTDSEETSKKLQEFVDAYNAVVDFFGAQSALDANGKATSPLFGDSSLRSVRSTLRRVVGGTVATTGNLSYQLLAQIGVKSDKDGKLTFDQSKFTDALADDEQAVAAVLTDSTNGIAGRLADQIDLYTDSIDGLIKTRTDSYDRQVKDTTSRITDAEQRLERYRKQLETKYANLETLLGQLQSQGNSLTSYFAKN